MRKILQISLFILLSFTAFFSSAYAQTDTLHVYLTNATNDKLIFNRVISSKPGNQFSIDMREIKPGATAVITVEKLIDCDIQGTLSFVNAKNENNVLIILDQEQVHYGQPIFDMQGPKLHSIVESKIHNAKIGPRYLNYSEATLRILENS